MTTRYPFHEVIAEALTEVFENLIKKGIGELPLRFTVAQDNECFYYLITDSHENPWALLYFSYEKLGFEERLKQFLQIVERLRSKPNAQISAYVIGIGLWELATFKEFRRTRIAFHMLSDGVIIDTFKWYDFEIDDALTIDIDNYIRYQNLSKDEKIEIADVLLEGVQYTINLSIRKPIKPQPQTPISSHPS